MSCVPGHTTFTPTWCDYTRLIVESTPEPETHEVENVLRNLSSGLNYRYVTSMRDYLAARNIYPVPIFGARFSTYHLIEVPLTNVFSVIGGLYQHQSILPPGLSIRTVEPDYTLGLSAPQVRVGTNFSLKSPNSNHAAYRAALNVQAAASAGIDGSGVRIAIVDTGLETGKAAQSFKDITDPAGVQDDADGHGTAMFEIISDIARGAEIYVFRTTQSTTVFVWDLMASLIAAVYDVQANLVNVSIGCQYLDMGCKLCGGYKGNRSEVCEHLISTIGSNPASPGQEPIIVAAAGNDGWANPFEWPARYESVLAVGAVTASNQLSSFSNVSKIRPSSQFYCLCPGGEISSGLVTECAGEGSDGGAITKVVGTSASTAYATGILALLRQYHDQQGTASRNAILDTADRRAKRDIVNAASQLIYSRSDHGMGRLIYDP